ncbi:MAG TPA: fibronectin type III domain-containing protein, partial [Solirubrobacterales bacterium]|nr:fibronectin type III domain-containing protein [Solirubrobacterales bacterium]
GGSAAWEGEAPAPGLTSAPCDPPASEGSPITEPTEVEAELSGLETGVPYTYRLIASNPNGRNIGLQEMVIPQPSLVKTGIATAIARTSATLNGTADPEGLSSTFYFEYGATKKYGKTSSVPPGESVGTTTPGDQQVSKGIAGLEPGRTYHYRLVEVNSKGTSYGVDRTFTVETAVKHLSTDPANPVGRVSATLKGTLDPDGMGTDYYFQYGTSRRYGEETPEETVANVTPGDQGVSVEVPGLEPETTYHFRLVAENATYGITYGVDRTFTTPPAIKGIETEAATGVLPTETTLHGHLDPDGFDTTFYFEYGKTKLYGHTIAAPPGDDVGTSAPGNLQLAKTLEGLEPGTTYHFRIVGENETGATAGKDMTFKTPQAPSIEGVFSSDVTASSASLRGRINPNGTEPSFETTYRFQYGTTTSYGQSVPAGDGTLPATPGGQNVNVPISGLSEVTYHFRLVAENDWGTAVSEDQTLDFKAPSSCPNTTVRQQTGAAYLPDCRAYELVSPANAGGSLLLPNAPESPYATNRFAFTGAFNAIPGSGNPPNSAEDLYVATRTAAGWVTRYVGLQANEALGQMGFPGEPDITGNGTITTDRSLDRFLTWRVNGGSVGALRPASYAPYLWDNEGNALGRLPTNFAEVPGADDPPGEGGYEGDAKLSGDGNHYVFSSVGLSFAPGGLEESPGSVYDEDISTETVNIVSKTPAEADIPKDGAAGSPNEYIRIPAVSRDGSHILMSTAAAAGTHLYMTVDGTEHYEVSLGEDEVNHGVRFEAMSEDGTEVFFTTAAQMTGDDTDESADLYLWDENGGSPSLTRISVGDEGSYGDNDACNPTWTTSCDVEVVPVDNRFYFGPFRYHPIDTALAEKGGTIYFYSPEQLEGSRGIPNLRNLYVWREGVVRHVATLESTPNGSATRIDVSPNGKFMAFVTKTKIGAYENAGHAEMYRYDAQARALLCVSCKPDGSSPTSDVEASQNGAFMTEDGRVFFSTEDALVPRDANGIRDVYEYVGGRAQLITTGTGDNAGTSSTPIGLVGVSADGTDAFVSTYETLVGQDENGPFLKFYDARVNGGFPFNKPPAPCAAADECHGEGSSSPVAPTIGTGATLGAGGNVSEATPRKQAKRRQAQCRRRRAQRRHRGHRRQCHRRREARR